jgi:hypothetical protein
MARSTSAKNGHERVVNDRDNAKHLEYFMNGQWRHSNNCKDFTNKECHREKVLTTSLSD